MDYFAAADDAMQTFMRKADREKPGSKDLVSSMQLLQVLATMALAQETRKIREVYELT